MTRYPRPNERPGTPRRRSQATSACRPQGPRGARPHPRPRRRARPTQVLQFTERDVARSSIRKCLASAVANAEHNDSQAARRALRVGLLRRRGPDAQALAAPCPRPRHPHPQAHLPHHVIVSRMPEELLEQQPARTRPSRRTARLAAAASRLQAARRERVARSRAAAAEAAEPHDHDHVEDEHDHDHDEDEDVVEPEMVEVEEVDLDEVAEDVATVRQRPTRRMPLMPMTRRQSRRPSRRTTTTKERSRSNGSEGQPVRVPPRRHHRLEEPVVQRPRVHRLPHRGLEDPRLPDDAAAARRDQPHRGRAHP